MAFLTDSILLDIGVLVLCLLAAVYAYFKYSFTYWKKLNVPQLEPIFPVGNFTDMALGKKSTGQIYADIYRRFEGERFAGTYSFATPAFLLRDPELIKHVLVKDFSSFHDRGIFSNENVEPLTGHLFLLSGQKWRNLRVKLTPTFTSGKMKMMFPTLAECGDELKNCLKESAERGDVIEVKDILARYSTDIISSCAFGIQCNCLKNPDAEFRQWGKKVFKFSFIKSMKTLLSQTAPKVMEILRTSIIDADISQYFRNMVKETVEYREKNNYKRNDFMQLLIQLKNNGVVDVDDGTAKQNERVGKEKGSESADQGLSMNSLAAQAFVFFIAGFETSSSTMQFCLYELAKNPDIQERVRQEVNMILKNHDGKVTYEAILEMKYLDKVVSETLRKYPPAPVLFREVTKEYKVPGTEIVLKKGTSTVVPIMGLHYDPKYFPNPEKFDPERFNDEEKAKRHPYVYLPFGEGPRICIGMRFGLMQTKVGLVSILSGYKVSVTDKTPIPLVIDPRSLILAVVGGMWLRLNKC